MIIRQTEYFNMSIYAKNWVTITINPISDLRCTYFDTFFYLYFICFIKVDKISFIFLSDFLAPYDGVAYGSRVILYNGYSFSKNKVKSCGWTGGPMWRKPAESQG